MYISILIVYRKEGERRIGIRPKEIKPYRTYIKKSTYKKKRVVEIRWGQGWRRESKKNPMNYIERRGRKRRIWA
jgi:hypothetical protein